MNLNFLLEDHLLDYFHNKGYYVIDRISVIVMILIGDQMRSTIFIVMIDLWLVYLRSVTFYLNL